MPRIVCISDTHLAHDFKIPDGDILIHAGDLTVNGTYIQTANVGNWLRSLPHKHKVIIAGNHDFLFEKKPEDARVALGPDIIYLQDSEVTVEGLRIWGSPWTPRFYDWAFQLDHRKRPDNERPFLLGKGRNAEQHWEAIPEGLDVLVTHGPPLGILDGVPRASGLDHVGDPELLKTLGRLKAPPKLHVFGHIHAGHGTWQDGLEETPTLFVNAAICDECYLPTQEPHVIDL